MDKAKKASVVATLHERLAKASSVVLSDFRGLNAAAVHGLRTAVRKERAEYHVVKNTLATLALKGTKHELLAGKFTGTTAMALGFEDPSAPAKVLAKLAKDNAKIILKHGSLDGELLDAKGVAMLATMPGKQELRAKLLGTLLAPATSLVRLLNAPASSFVRLLEAQRKEMEAKAPAPAAPAATEAATDAAPAPAAS